MNAFRATTWLGIMAGLVATGVAPLAQTPTAASSYGPGRIICRSATSCELGIGTPPRLKYRIDPSLLAAADKERLGKQCTAKAGPCVATVTGAEIRNVVKAASIKFYN